MYAFLFTKATTQKPRIQYTTVYRNNTKSRFFSIAFFYNKILFSFYYICYLLENETLAQELFGGSLDELLGTYDDHLKVDFDVIAQEVFGASIQEIIDIKSEVITCDDTMRDWDAAADDILENIQRDEEEEQEESDDDEGNENTFDTIIPDFLLLSTLALLKILLLITECQLLLLTWHQLKL